jgi:hypothetical protein
MAATDGQKPAQAASSARLQVQGVLRKLQLGQVHLGLVQSKQLEAYRAVQYSSLCLLQRHLLQLLAAQQTFRAQRLYLPSITNSSSSKVRTALCG